MRRSLALGDWRDERGAYAILFAVLIVALFTMVAIVVDLSNARAQVRDNRSRVDFAALAAGTQMPKDPAAACTAAWNYIRSNTPDLPSGAVSPCTSGVPQAFNAVCNSSTAAVTYRATGSAPYEIRFTFPVPDSHPEMQGVVRPETDGTDQCHRFAITMRTTAGSLFGGVVGARNLSAPASAVVRGTRIGTSQGVVALLLLDPVGCVALEAKGGGSESGGVQVFPSGAIPGFISVDSNGTVGCGGANQVTLDANGTGSNIRACGVGSTLPDTCLPGGVIELFAMQVGQTTCGTGNLNACDPADVPAQVSPQPIPLDERRTRAPADHRYNCQAPNSPAVYRSVVPLRACEDPTNSTPDLDGDGFSSDYVDELRRHIGSSGTPSGFSLYTGPCTIASGTSIVVGPGNWFVDCDVAGKGLRVNGTITFQGGNIVFRNGVNLSGGTLNVNTAPDASVLPSQCLSRPDSNDDGLPERPLGGCPTNYSANHSYMFFRSGDLNRSGSNNVINIQKSTLFINNGRLDASGGDGNVTWISPTEGPFEDLALWSEGSSDHSLKGSSTQSLEGAFFTPNATFNYVGGGGQDQAKAQFLTYRMKASGNGVLRMSPDPDRAILFPVFGFRLIR